MGNSPSRIETDMRDSPLGDLPAELRNAIWESVFAGVWDGITLKLFRKPEFNILIPYPGGHPRLTLLQSCRQVNREAAGFAWTNVRAILDCDDLTLDCPTTNGVLDACMSEKVIFMSWWKRIIQKPQQLRLIPCPRLENITILEIDFSEPRTLSCLNNQAVRDLTSADLSQLRLSLRVSNIIVAIMCLYMAQAEAVMRSRYGVQAAPAPDSRLSVDASFKTLLEVMPSLGKIDVDSEKTVGRFRYEKQPLREESATLPKVAEEPYDQEVMLHKYRAAVQE
nr:hypothetical protein B0A51_00413 [Rachicladosporium sp. CCFEE 5018]